jgi:hypothetical protein
MTAQKISLVRLLRDQIHSRMFAATVYEIFRLGRVDELFDDNPCGHEMNECQKGLAQFLIPRGNASKLFEVINPSMWPQLSSSLERFFVFSLSICVIA